MAVLRKVAVAILVLVLAFAVLMAARSLMSKKPNNLGVANGRLAPVSQKPNAVSSQMSDPAHAVEPLRFTGSPDAAMAALEGVLRAMPRMAIVETSKGYLRAEATSRLFRFVDDFEAVVDPAAKVIHVRSAARVGHSDLGVNRARVEEVRKAFDAAK